MVFDDKKVIFLHSGKTGGSAFELMMEPARKRMDTEHFNEKFCYGKIDGKHTQHASAILLALCAGTRWREYDKITIVRNPYERLHSVYHYNWRNNTEKFKSFENFILSIPDRWPDPYSCSFLMPQWWYCSIDGEWVVDRILRFESLQEDVNKFRRDYKIHRKFPKFNTHTNPEREMGIPAIEHYTEEMLSVMLAYYSDDFEELGYEHQLYAKGVW